VRRTRLALHAVVVAAVVSVLAGVGAAAAPPRTSLTPVFTSYEAPAGVGDDAGEPTLGINPNTGAVLFQSYTTTLRVTDFKQDGTARWEAGRFPVPQPVSFDPILETDPDTGRTFTSQLLLACSQGGYTDDDGRTFQLSEGCGPASAFDHQTVGFGRYVDGGPLAALRDPVADYPNVVYYCAQDYATATCSMSTDGGRTFPTSAVAYTYPECPSGGVFGHIKSAPDGTVYLPPRTCYGIVGDDAGQSVTAVAVSEDNGLTWDLREATGTAYGDAGHPSVGVGRNGDVYLAYGGRSGPMGQPGGGPPMAVMSKDKGKTWTAPVALGADVGIRNTRFSVAVAGDAGRAAVGFLGSRTAGDANDRDAFRGRWDLYVAFTKDSGRTWRTTLATPEHPVQVGSVCTNGVACGDDRNLLDFNDMVIDPATGRVVVALADGCPGRRACTPQTRFRKAVISRQTGGQSLYASPDRGRR
jgi:hypothetical protein